MKIEDIIQEKLRIIFHDESIVFDKSRFAGGLTNYNYIMKIKGTDYVVRQPGGMTNHIIDRKIEKVNNRTASELGLNSECVHFDEDTGIKISAYIPNSQNVALADPCKSENLKAVSGLMKKIHSSSKHFPNIFDWKNELHKYEKIVNDLKGEFFFDYAVLKKMLFVFVDKHITNTYSRPCHNDTVPENFIINEEGRVFLIDWEYSGMNDPSWDVAAFILESKLSEEAVQYLLREYYGELRTSQEEMKIKCFMLVQDLLWTVWALIRHYNGDDFLDYCNYRYERFRKNIEAITYNAGLSIAEML